VCIVVCACERENVCSRYKLFSPHTHTQYTHSTQQYTQHASHIHSTNSTSHDTHPQDNENFSWMQAYCPDSTHTKKKKKGSSELRTVSREALILQCSREKTGMCMCICVCESLLNIYTYTHMHIHTHKYTNHASHTHTQITQASSDSCARWPKTASLQRTRLLTAKQPCHSTPHCCWV
jgi:hypothetical protein